MDTSNYIKTRLKNIQKGNEKSTDKYKKQLLSRIEDNLLNKKQSIKDNEGLILRYKGAKPQGLNQMQLALQEAVENAE